MLSFLLIIWGHYVADFVFQLDRMAKNKSKSVSALKEHIYWYSFILFLFAIFIFKFNIVLAILYVLVNGISHYYVDKYTSKITSRLYAKGKMGADKFPNFGFYSIIGLDQAIHMTILIVSYMLMI